MSPWQAGAAALAFPVATGTPMAGYMARLGPATGVLDELTVSALVIMSGARTLAIVAADIAAVDVELVSEVARATGLDRSELLLCASHTHSGPAGVVPRLHPADIDQGNPALRASFVATAASAIRAALANLEPVDLRYGSHETSSLAANRNDPAGPFDPQLSVVATRRRNDEVGAVLVHFACHPTILSADNRLISADFPGALRRSVRASLPPSAVVLYLNGAAGDVSTRFTREAQDVTEVERVGANLASAAVAALAGARPLAGSIRYAQQRVSLPPRPRDEPAVTDRESGDGAVSVAERRRAETRAQGATLLAKLAGAGPGVIRSSLDLEVWRLGDLALLAVPGELFASLGAQIAGGAPLTRVVGYANGYSGYLVDDAAHAAGTYEALASPYAPGGGERVAAAARALLTHPRSGASDG